MEGDDGDQMEMTERELQKWIREKVEESKPMDPEVLKKCHLLQSLLKRREKQAATFLKLCESVAECEAVIKKLYCLIGWVYRDADSDDERLSGSNSVINVDDDGDVMDCDNLPQSTYEAAPTETEAPSSMNAASPAPKSKQRQKRRRSHDADKGQTPPKDEEGSSSLKLMKNAVVVLTKLPACKIRSSLRPRVPLQYSSDEDLSNCDSDTQWEPQKSDSSDSSDSDCSIYSSGMKSHKRRGTHQKTGKLKKNHKVKAAAAAAAPQAEAVANANAKKSRTAPQGNKPEPNQRTKTSETSKTAPSQINTSVAKEAATKQTETAQNLSTDQSCALVVSSLSQALPNQTTQPPADLPQEEIKVNMMVLARRRALRWERGKIVDILTKEDGRVKYKVDFQEKARGLVSGHHIAFDRIPALGRLYIGARVVAEYDRGNQPRFYSGVLGEMPNRKNRMRFLIFFDDQKPLYVGLPCLYLVCRPLKDVTEDITDSSHREFMKEYLKIWPYPPLTQHRVGQTICAEYQGAQKKCEVLEVDCSLIQVVFEDDKHKEWIYRGSVRLEHIAGMKKQMDEDVEKRKPESETTNKDGPGCVAFLVQS